MAARIFRSKIDAWFVAVIVVAVTMIAASLTAAAYSSQDAVAGTGMIVASLALIALIGWMLVTTRYTIDGRTLTIVSGPLRWRVPIDAITSVESTRSLLSSPALSIDRLRICYSGGKRVMISPADKMRFIRALGMDIKDFNP